MLFSIYYSLLLLIAFFEVSLVSIFILQDVCVMREAIGRLDAMIAGKVIFWIFLSLPFVSSVCCAAV